MAKISKEFRKDMDAGLGTAYRAIAGASAITEGIKSLSSELRAGVEEMDKLLEESRALRKRIREKQADKARIGSTDHDNSNVT